MALNQSLPFSRGEALKAGITVRELAGPAYIRLLHGVYVSSTVPPSLRIRARAALRISQPGAWASHHTACLLWGGWAPDCPDLHVTVPKPQTRSIRRGVFSHRARPDSRPVRRFGIALSAPVDVFLDLAGLHLDLIDLVAAGDSLVKATSIEPQDLVLAAATWSGRGARFARRAARYVRTGVDSASESRLRLLLVLGGLPEPVVNRITRLANGDWKWRFDLCYPEFKVLIEYDGEHHEGDGQRKLDEARRDAIRREGWLVIVVRRTDLSDPSSVLTRVADALRERGCTDVPRRFPLTWQRHFVIRRSVAA